MSQPGECIKFKDSYFNSILVLPRTPCRNFSNFFLKTMISVFSDTSFNMGINENFFYRMDNYLHKNYKDEDEFVCITAHRKINMGTKMKNMGSRARLDFLN